MQAAHATRELLDQKRASGGLAWRCPPLGASCVLVVGAEEGERESLRLRRGRVARRTMSRRSALSDQCAFVSIRKGLESASPSRCVMTSRDRGRRRRADELEQQRGAVDVPPVDVVDVDDEGAACKDGEELAQRDEGAHPHVVRVHDRLAVVRYRCSGPAAAPGRSARGARCRPGALRARRPLPACIRVATEGIDHAVECLVRHRLTLVSAPSQDVRLAALDEPVEEVARDGRLAHARMRRRGER